MLKPLPLLHRVRAQNIFFGGPSGVTASEAKVLRSEGLSIAPRSQEAKLAPVIIKFTYSGYDPIASLLIVAMIQFIYR